MPISYARHRFPPAIIQHAVWLYLRGWGEPFLIEEHTRCCGSHPSPCSPRAKRSADHAVLAPELVHRRSSVESPLRANVSLQPGVLSPDPRECRTGQSWIEGSFRL